MLYVPVPGGEDLSLEHLVLDANGTLSGFGELIPAAAQTLALLRQELGLHVLSAGICGTAEARASGLGATFRRVADESLEVIARHTPLRLA